MEDARLVQVRHAGADAARQPHLCRGAERLAGVGQQLLQRAAIDVLGERVQLTLVHAHTHKTAAVGQTDVQLAAHSIRRPKWAEWPIGRI